MAKLAVHLLKGTKSNVASWFQRKPQGFHLQERLNPPVEF